MAKVLKTKRGASTPYKLLDGIIYDFPVGKNNPNCDGSALILNDEHAKGLLQLFADELVEIPFTNWSLSQKEKAKEHEAAVIKEAIIKYPGYIKKEFIKLVEKNETPKK